MRVKSFCRICQAFCGTELTLEDGRIVQVAGDRRDPLSKGYACFKGLQAAEQHHGAGRLLRPLVRSASGDLKVMSAETALAQAGEQLAAIHRAHGPESIAFFLGTQSLFNAVDVPMVEALATALGTPRLYGTMTIDQSAKWVAEARLGAWDGGVQDFDGSDVWMFVGANPMVSVSSGVGVGHQAFSNPVKTLKAARDRGMKLIVVDPRRTETARFADLHLAPRPGLDAMLLASMLHVVLREGWEDGAFCAEHASGLPELRRAIAGFAPGTCAEPVGVSAAEIELAARMFACEGRRGMAGSGTGPNMARHSNLAEHLIQVLNVVCGRFPRAGEPVANPGVLQSAAPRRAQARSPGRGWEKGPRSRVHGLGMLRGQMMSATLVDEILHQGDGRIRALVCVGGNPAVALPEQRRALDALAALDLLIVIDPRLTATARLATFVFPPRLQYERADHTARLELMFKGPFAHATEAIVQPPAGSDLVEDWEVLWALARGADVDLFVAGQRLGADAAPTTRKLLDLLAARGRVPLDEVRAADGGRFYPAPDVRVLPADASRGRFELLAPDVAAELTTVADELARPPVTAAMVLIVRRHREVMNSAGTDFAATRARFAGNPAYLHPDDLADRGIAPGGLVRIASATGAVHAVATIDRDLRRGVVSMSHAWAGLPDRPEEATNALVDAVHEVQSINRMPVMTGIPVDVVAVP